MTPRQPAAPRREPFDEARFAAVRASVEVRRSARRTRTVTAFREGGRTIVSIPARFSRTQEREWVDIMVMKIVTQDQRRRPSDAQLFARAAELSATYFGGKAEPASVAWSTRQGRRWGSCTPSERSIRISTRIRGMPPWVVDYVLLHELAHLLRSGHGPEFWALLEVYPLAEKAKGFLEGYAFAEDGGADDGGDPDDDSDPDDSDPDDSDSDDSADEDAGGDGGS